jgi:Tol biopolymer transport system component
MGAKRAVVLALGVAAAAASSASAAPTTERVSVNSQEEQVEAGAGAYSGTAISQDGRFVLFESKSRTLAPGGGAGLDLFVRDRLRGTTRIVSVRVGRSEATSAGFSPSISRDGRYVAFVSYSSNLVRGDTNGTYDVFVRDMRRRITTRLVPPGRRQTDDGSIGAPTLSADGRYLAFVSDSAQWVRGDTNRNWDVFVHDRRTGATRLISKGLDGRPANKDSSSAVLAAGGRHVAYWSAATNVVRRDTNDRPDLFVHDLRSGTTVRATVSTSGEQARFPEPGYVAQVTSISADGRRVAFMSRAANLVAGDTNRRSDVFVHDLSRHETSRVSVTSSGEQVCEARPPGGFGCVGGGWISADGHRVAFLGNGSDLVAGDTNDAGDVFVHDLRTRETTRVSVDPAGGEVCERRRQTNPGCSEWPSISGDGRFIAFMSRAGDVVPGDTNGSVDVFVRGPL